MPFADYILSVAPDWLTARVGAPLVASVGELADSLMAALRFGVREAMIGEAQADAYPAHLRNSGMAPLPGEAPAATLAVLESRWDQWHECGSYQGVRRAVGRYTPLGSAGVGVASTFDLILSGYANPFGNLQGFFFVALLYPNPFSDDSSGLAYAGGQSWGVPVVGPAGGDENVWGSNGETFEQLQALKADIVRYKHPLSSCRFIVIATDADFSLNPGSPTGFDGGYMIVPMFEQWESQPPFSTTGLPAEHYNFSPLIL